MRFAPTRFDSAWLITPDRIEDDRGFLARTWCEEEFAAHNIFSRVAQCNVSFNKAAGTLRGLHWQAEPAAEAKLVRCTAGAIFDVIVDVRPASQTFACWEGFELSSANRNMLYIPEGFAHGFVTIEDNSEVFYQMSEPYAAGLSRGLNWADKTIGIDWHYPVRVISARDRTLPALAEIFPALDSAGVLRSC